MSRYYLKLAPLIKTPYQPEEYSVYCLMSFSLLFLGLFIFCAGLANKASSWVCMCLIRVSYIGVYFQTVAGGDYTMPAASRLED